MRTGKTKLVVDTIGIWAKTEKIKSVIIVAPNGVHVNWTRIELPKHAWFSYGSHAWVSHKAKQKNHSEAVGRALKANLTTITFGKESILTDAAQDTIKAILKRGPCALIVDESHHFGKPGAKRTRNIRSLAKKCAYKRILTGTPIGNSPLRLYSQFEILEPGCLGFKRYTDFKNHYAVFGQRTASGNRKYEVVEEYQNLDELRKRVERKASIVLRKDCEDLPDIINIQHYYEPSARQRQAYNDLLEKFIHELDDGSEVSGIEMSTRLIRLQQILSNFAVTEGMQTKTVDEKKDPRLDALCDLIDGPTIIWCRFRECIKRVIIRLRKRGISAVEYHGKVKMHDRITAQVNFMSGRSQVFVGQPSCAGEGLDLSAASTIIWYSHVFDLVVREQANERATKRGHESVSIIDLIAPGSIDDQILTNLRKKQKIVKAMTDKEFRHLLISSKL